MIPKRFISEGGGEGGAWEDLKQGAPTIRGFANLCAAALAHEQDAEPSLAEEAQAILYVARERGVIELKSVENAFDAAERLLAVYVERDENHTFMFRDKENLARTMKYLEGFRQLCTAGLVIHHLLCEFSLTHHGFEVARKIDPQQIQNGLSLALETET